MVKNWYFQFGLWGFTFSQRRCQRFSSSGTSHTLWLCGSVRCGRSYCFILHGHAVMYFLELLDPDKTAWVWKWRQYNFFGTPGTTQPATPRLTSGYPVSYRVVGFGCSNPPPRNSEGPPKSCQTQPDLWKPLKIAEFRKPTPQDVQKKGQ